MGIVLKRRDNAPIVKEICGNIINFLINYKDPEGAIKYTIQALEDMFNGKYDIKYFLQSRTLKSKESYKDWSKIAHIYLANKISIRSPGETPQSGDRIEYAVIKVPNLSDRKKLLQGDIIETPQYIKENKLEIDYLFYLTNQILNPALQFLELVNKNSKYIFTNFIEKYKISFNKKKEKSIRQYIFEIKIFINKINNKNKNKINKINNEINEINIKINNCNKNYNNLFIKSLNI